MVSGHTTSPSAPSARAGTLGTWRAIGPSTWLALLLVVLAIVFRVWTLRGGLHDYDEGVYWQSLRAMAAGRPLFTAVFSSQPPLFLLMLYPFYLLFGQSLVAARLAIVLYSLVGLAAIYVAGRVLGGPWVGVAALALLATDPLYLQESYTLQAEVPALALALAAVACALLMLRASGARRRWLGALTGLLLALGCGAKLFDAVTLVPIALYVLTPLGPSLLDRAGFPRWPGISPVLAALRQTLPDFAACLGGIVVGAAAVLLPFIPRWSALYDQAVRFHVVAGRVLDAGISFNVNLLAGVQSELPLEALAVLAVLCGLLRRHWAVLVPALWGVASLTLLLWQQPLFAHHVALLMPPLVLCVVVALPHLIAVAATALDSAQGAARIQWRVPRLLVWALVGLVAIWGVFAGGSQLGTAASLPRAESRAAAAVAAVTQPGDLVVADDQFIVGLADRDVPPQLVDTSEVRIVSGYLTLSQLEQAVLNPRVTAVLFYSGRFDTVPGFRAWMTQHYTLIGTFGGNSALYIKAPPPLAPV